MADVTTNNTEFRKPLSIYTKDSKLVRRKLSLQITPHLHSKLGLFIMIVFRYPFQLVYFNDLQIFYLPLSYVILAAVTLGALSRCFLPKQQAYNAAVCDRSSFSNTTQLQRFVP